MKPLDRIVTLTMNPSVDLSASVEEVLPDHKLRCGDVRTDPGGGGINVSRALKRLGGESLAIHSSGGASGKILDKLLDAEGIDHRSFSVNGLTRQNTTYFERSTGRQYRFVTPGPKMSVENWKRALSAVRLIRPSSRLVVASGSLPPGVPEDFYAELARIISKRGGRMILDASGPPLKIAIKEKVFMIKASLRELNELAGGRAETPIDQEREAMEIIEKGQCEIVLVSLGPDGLLFASARGCKRFCAPVVEVKGNVGAGDSMVAGIAWALSRRLPVHHAVRFGVAAGTAAVMNPGTELCHRSDAQALFPQIRELAIHLETARYELVENVESFAV